MCLFLASRGIDNEEHSIGSARAYNLRGTDQKLRDGHPIEFFELSQSNLGVAFLPRMCVEQEIERKTLCEVRVREMHVERKIRLIYPTRRVLSHAAKAFLEVLG